MANRIAQEYRADVQLELVNTLYRQSPPILFGNIAVVSLTTFLLWHEVSRHALLAWAAAICVLTAIRTAMVWRDRRAGEHPAGTATRRARKYMVFAGVSGCLWGAMGVLFFSPDNTIVTALICIVLAGMTGGSVASLSSWWPTYVAYALPTVLPFAIRSFAYGSSLFSVLGFLSLFLLAVNLAFSRTLQRTVRDAVSLRFENVDLIRQLTQEKERAELANRSKSQFLAAASHDLRQPTHALGLYIATLRAMARAPSVDGTALDDIAERLRTALKGMSQLLNVLLDISRLDAGVIDVEPRRFALQQALDALDSQFRQAALAKGVTLRIRPTAIWLETDAVLLHTILSNLLSNAVRYTQRGGILLACRRRGTDVEIQVFDTGIGIAGDQLPHIFREFYQIGNAARDREQGLGLGLAIVQRTAALINASVQVRSTAGRGSLFSVRLAMADHAPSHATGAHPSGERAGAGRGQARKTILVVDDDRDVLAGMQTLLQTWGHTVIAAPSLERAIELAVPRRAELDMIVTDFRLAGHVTGADVVHRVFRVIGREIPAIIITGDTSPEGIHAASSSGFSVMHKPLDPQEMQTLIDAPA
ncbi:MULTISPECIES: hybrid sensor histidine kinase/response regulator [unclassified Burkholderia]|uniref:hybrid sensor histidine kinase/response regulator n=1 Tax=unclassified Burkholderia TaxID=2613784 RepID=UPI000F56927B|nr:MULTISPECIES: hybrid sensor histidine kinase/response regulator [unclassified Burkholderia]RQR90211.1 hybrid sensor histidine kinase/response regulator [Burkholderia sp. Bp9011]RQR99221.1 hybrid sensor histidine kinase/response regulator [Burkholderia sp. Bp9010]RQS02693.1 hybrid sensor histidine kinase/response regulator [Burkholderia sp. Bp8991]RQS82231.1 hybrid sensor histidine kinase/response regulator [Burkholderia sp. Bp8977]